jgi:ankyrin repeat protein
MCYGNWTPLHEVCNHGFENMVFPLLNANANINMAGGDTGVTPLHEAVLNRHPNIVKALLEFGAGEIT